MSKSRKGNKGRQSPVSVVSRLDYLAILPAVFMCLLTFFVLLLDVVVPGMFSEQYQDYPSMFRLTHISIVCAGVLFWIIYLKQNGLKSISPASVIRPDTVYVLFFGIFCILMIVSTIANGIDDKVIHGVSYRDIGVLHILAFFLFYCFLSAKIGRPGFRTFALVMFVSVADLIGAAALTDRFIVPIEAFAAKKELSTIFFNGNHYGYFLTMTVLVSAGLFIYYSNIGIRIFGLISLMLNGFVLLLNNTFGCILAVLVVLFLFFVISLFACWEAIRSFLLLFVIFLALGLLGGFVSEGIIDHFFALIEDMRLVAGGGDDADSAGHNRWLLWTQTVDYIREKPILGYGCEGISDKLLADTGRGNPHNELLTYAAYFGIPAAIAYTLGVLTAFGRFFRSATLRDPACAAAGMAAVGYFISALFGVPMFYTAPFFFIFLGLLLGGASGRQ